MFSWKKTLAAGLMFSVMAPPALAQSDDDDRSWWPRWGMQQMMMGQWGPGMMMGWGADRMLDRIDGRLAYLKAELKITEAQTAAWDELAEVVRTTAEGHNDMMRDMMSQFGDGGLDKPLPDRLAYHETHLAARLEQVKAVRAAADKLYGVLDDEQKKSADEIVLPMMGMGMGRGRGPGRMRW